MRGGQPTSERLPIARKCKIFYQNKALSSALLPVCIITAEASSSAGRVSPAVPKWTVQDSFGRPRLIEHGPKAWRFPCVHYSTIASSTESSR